MISINDTHAAPKAAPTYRIRTEAMNAAVATIGPHARHGFEYTTTKCDGRWVWKPTDEVPAPTPAEIKANGGKRSLIAMAAAIDGGQTIKPMEGTAMAKTTDGKIVPAKLPVPPRRAPGKAAGTSDRSEAIEQPPATENEPAPHNTAVAGTYDELKDRGGLRSNPIGPAFIVNEKMLNDLAPACNGLDIEPHDDLSIPEFLKRDASPEAKEKATQAMKRIAKQVGPDRTIKNPPDAKVAARRKAADEEAADIAKAKAKPAGKPPVSAKPAKAKPPAKNPASEARTRTAGHSGGNRYDWKGAAEAVKGGKMPKAPDFSAPTHERFRPLLAEVVKAAKAGDSATLRKITINPISSSPKAIAKFRDLCLLALKA